MRNGLRYLIFVADCAWIVAAFSFANLFSYGVDGWSTHFLGYLKLYAPLLAFCLLFWTVLFFDQKLEGFSRGWHFPLIISDLLVASACLVAAVFGLGFFLRLYYSRLTVLLFAFVLPAGLILVRCIAWSIVKSRSRSAAVRRVAIVGNGRLARELAHKISAHPELMIEVAGFLSPAAKRSIDGPKSSPARSVRTLDALNLLLEKNVREIIIAEQLPANSEVEKLLSSCQNAGMQIQFVPHWFELYLSKVRLSEIGDVPLVSLKSQTLSLGARGLKRAIDLILGSLLLVVSLPVMVLIYFMLGKKSPLKKEVRCGLNGKHFFLYSFNVDRWSKGLAGFEKFISQYSLTELPQVWNVIRGEMALVGPRPESPERAKHYSIWQRRRLSVKPGLTGLAQVNGLREHHSSAEKAHFDLQYIYHYSVFFDLSLILQTAWTLCYRLMETRFPGLHLHALAKKLPQPLLVPQEGLHADSAQSGSD